MKATSFLAWAAGVLGAPAPNPQAARPGFTEHVVTLPDGQQASVYLRSSMVSIAADIMNTNITSPPRVDFDNNFTPTQTGQDLCTGSDIQAYDVPPLPDKIDCERMWQSIAQTNGYWVLDHWDGQFHIMAYLGTCAISVKPLDSDKAVFIGNNDVAKVVTDTTINFVNQFNKDQCGSQGVISCTSVNQPHLHYQVVHNS